MTYYICEECGSRSIKQTWCPEHPDAVLDAVLFEDEDTDNEGEANND